MFNKRSVSMLIPLMGLCVLMVYMFLYTNNSYGAELDEAEKCFYAEGQNITIEAITDADRNNAPEDTRGKTVKITCYDSERSNVENTYYVTSDYTVYGGCSNADCATASIDMYSGKLHRIVAGGQTGNTDCSSIQLIGGTVDQVVAAEDGMTNSSYICIGDNLEGSLDVWIGAEENHSGKISSIALDAEDNPNVTLHMGYNDGHLISEINETSAFGASYVPNYVTGTINGNKLMGLKSFQETAGFTVNNKLTVLLDGRNGQFSNGEKTRLHSVTFPEDSESVEISDLPKPERKGYTFRGWMSDPYQITSDKTLYKWMGHLYAQWQKNDDPEPYDLTVTYYDLENEMEITNSVNTEDLGRNPISNNFDRSKGLVLSGYYPNGTAFSKKIEDYDADTGIWYCAVDSESVDKTVQNTYILSFYGYDNENDDSSQAFIRVSNPDTYDESTGNYEEFYEYSVNNLEAVSKDGTTVELPYNSMQKNWRVEFSYESWDSESDVGVKNGDVYESPYMDEIELNGKTKVSKTYEVKMKDGKVYDYRINLVESNGDSTDLQDMVLSVWDGESYFEDGSQDPISNGIDLESAVTEKGATAVIPYYYDEKKCGNIDVFYQPDEPGMKITGLEDSYTLDSNGERDIKFSVTSANGKNTKKYKVKLVQDKKGDSTEMECLEFHYIQWSNDDSGDDIRIPIDMEAAKTDVGATVVAPVDAAVNSAYFLVQGNTENYGVIDLNKYNYIEWDADIYKRPAKYNKTNDTLEFTVTSADKKHTQKYKVTVWQKGAKEFKDLSKVTISGIEDQEYTGSPIKLNPVLMDGDKKLTEGIDYTVAYKNNTQSGTASVIFTGMGDYTGSVTKQFQINKPGGTEKGLFAESNTIRLAGGTRYETAIEAADALKKSLDVDKFENIIVADGSNYPDALTGSYLAKVKKAPILLVNDSSALLVKDYIRRNLKSGGNVYILGGTGAVSGSFEKSLKNADLSVKRLAGQTRYDTNISILKESGVKKSDLLICSGNGFADSLSASAAGLPILLVDKNVSAVQKAYLDGISIDELYIIGGTGAVNAFVEKTMKQYGSVERLAGSTRYDTSKAVAQKFFKGKADAAVIAYGQNFPDGLAGGPLAMSLNAPLLLAENGSYSQAAGFVKAEGIQKGVVLGGSSLISNQVFSKIIK